MAGYTKPFLKLSVRVSSRVMCGYRFKVMCCVVDIAKIKMITELRELFVRSAW